MPPGTDLPSLNEAFERIWDVAERSRERRALSRAESGFVRGVVPDVLGSIHGLRVPKAIHHPGGFPVSGAPVGTFLKAALLLSGQKALGRRFDGHPFYEEVERDLAFGIMRSHFHHGYPKGTHCCSMCTLAVYPVLVAGAIRYFEAASLARDVRSLIEAKQWRFARAVNVAAIEWALGTQ